MAVSRKKIIEKATEEFKVLCDDTHSSGVMTISFTGEGTNVAEFHRFMSRPPLVVVPEERVFAVLGKFHAWIEGLFKTLGLRENEDPNLFFRFWIRTIAGQVGFYWNAKEKEFDDLFFPLDGRKKGLDV